MHYTWCYCKAIGKAGAGERNRTAVISLEGIGPLGPYQALSDKWALKDPLERKRLISAVRTTEAAPNCCRRVNAQTELDPDNRLSRDCRRCRASRAIASPPIGPNLGRQDQGGDKPEGTGSRGPGQHGDLGPAQNEARQISRSRRRQAKGDAPRTKRSFGNEPRTLPHEEQDGTRRLSDRQHVPAAKHHEVRAR